MRLCNIQIILFKQIAFNVCLGFSLFSLNSIESLSSSSKNFFSDKLVYIFVAFNLPSKVNFSISLPTHSASYKYYSLRNQ